MKFPVIILSFLIASTAFACGNYDSLSGSENSSNHFAETKVANIVPDGNKEKNDVAAIDTTRFSSVVIKTTDKTKKYSLSKNIEYPQLIKPTTSNETKFNDHIKRYVDDHLTNFTKFLEDKEKGTKENISRDYELNLNYQIDYFSADLVSIIMYWDGFSGYLNQDHFPETVNYDLKAGKLITLDQLFISQADHLNIFSEQSRTILKSICLSCGCENGIKAGEPLTKELIEKREVEGSTAAVNVYVESGTKPEKENFDNWSISSKGIKITFSEYQIGPGCLGIVNFVIPYDDLRSLLNTRFANIK